MNRWSGGSVKRVSISKSKQDGANKKRRIIQQVAPLPLTIHSSHQNTNNSEGNSSKIFRIQSTPMGPSTRSTNSQQQEFSFDMLSLQQLQQPEQHPSITTPQQYEINISRSYSTTPTSTNEEETEIVVLDEQEETSKFPTSRSSSRASINSTPNALELDVSKIFSKQKSVSNATTLPSKSTVQQYSKTVMDFKPISPSLPNFKSQDDIESMQAKRSSPQLLNDSSMKQFIFNSNESIKSAQATAIAFEEDNINFLDLIGCSKESKKQVPHFHPYQEDSSPIDLQVSIPTSFLDSQPQQQSIPLLYSPKTPITTSTTIIKTNYSMQQQMEELQQENITLKQTIESLRKQLYHLSKNKENCFNNGVMEKGNNCF